MKKALLTLFLGAICAFSQPSATSVNGGNNYVSQRVYFGGNLSLGVTSSTDTLSDPVVMLVNSTRPIQYMTLEYKAIAADSNNSGYQIDIWTRTCQNPSQSTGCPSKWVQPPRRTIYGNSRFTDTITVSRVRQDTVWFSHTFFITTGNQIAFRVYKAGSSTQNLQQINFTGN